MHRHQILLILSHHFGISKQDKEIAVVMSTQRYSELTRLEDILYGKAAELVIKEGFASNKETQDLMDSIA